MMLLSFVVLTDADAAVILVRSRDAVNILGFLRALGVLFLGVLYLFLVFRNCLLFIKPK